MEECPQCGQIPREEDEQCPHCGYPFDPAAQAEYRSPQMKQIEEEILSQVIARVESYWATQQAEADKEGHDQVAGGQLTDRATRGGARAKTSGGRGRCGLLKCLAWVQLGLGLVSAFVLLDATGSRWMSEIGYAAPLLIVSAGFWGVAGWALLLAAGDILEAVSGKRR